MVTKNIGVILLLAASLAAGATYLLTDRNPPPVQRTPANPVIAPSTFDATAPIEERIAALEEALGVERQARHLLQEELVVLTAELESLSDGDMRISDAVEEPVATAEQSVAARQSRRRRNNPEQRIERMIDAGFTPSEAERILRRESEMQMQALQARYEARRAGEPGRFSNPGAGATTMREELGDDGYERYLTANGRPTQIAVSAVLEGSPALRAGLQPGDEIVTYDGRRVFNMNEITALTMQGEPGQNVIVNISRGGVPMQISMPRGPLGITGGRRFRR